ncbi:MAG: polysaccharide deacetylase family protein [Clostridium sp.]
MKKSRKIIGIITLVLTLSCTVSKPSYGEALVREKKTVYLTFDDGPSTGTTNNIIDVLNENNIKATFFIIGLNARRNVEIIKRINENGMSIMPHADKHEYNTIYSSKSRYFEDLTKCEDTITRLTGKSNFNFVRMPGGSDNDIARGGILNEIKEQIVNDNRYYIDWSLDIGDTDSAHVSVESIESRVRDQGALYRVEVLLMHDMQNKLTTTQSLQSTIDFYKERGYEFKTLDNIDASEIEYLKEIRVINKK